MLSWGLVKSLGLFFGPMLLPKAISYYKSIRNAPKVIGKPVQPVPANVQRAIFILTSFAIITLVTTFLSSPENIFTKTQSRLQIPTDVLFTRLNAIRSTGLTPSDNALRQKLVSLESRLLYLAYGPDALANCLWCSVEDARSYLYYSVPAILTPHLANLCILALVTSGLFIGKEAEIWRMSACVVAACILGLELYAVSTFNHQANARATRLEDLDMFYWKTRVWRGIALSLLDLSVAALLYLSSTNRAFVTPLTAAERIEATTKVLENSRNKTNSALVMRNTILRDDGLKARMGMYWTREGEVMGDAMEDAEVVEGVRNAITGRINVGRCSEDAEIWAGRIVEGVLEDVGVKKDN